jgi:acyl carrier protein
MADFTAEGVLTELQPIFEEVLEQPGLIVTRNSSSWNTPNWDSLAHIDLIEMSERHFGVKFSLNELQDLKEVGDLVDLILAKKSEQAAK